MATGTDSFMGKAMPIVGNATLTGETAADDILTITGASSQSGDYLVIENSSGTELFYIDSNGGFNTGSKVDFDFAGSAAKGIIWDASADRLSMKNSGAGITKLNLGDCVTAPTTGVDVGDLFIIQSSAVFRLGVVTTGTTKVYTTKFQYTAGSSS